MNVYTDFTAALTALSVRSRHMYSPCYVCKLGKVVENPRNIMDFPNQPSIRCEDVEQAGFDGMISPEVCPLLHDKVKQDCGCREIFSDSSYCPLCGIGASIVNEDNLITFNGQTSMTCKDLEILGDRSLLDSTQCKKAINDAPSICGCQERAPQSQACSICGKGSQIRKTNSTIQIGKDRLSCQDLSVLGEKGYLDPTLCSIIQPQVEAECGCEYIPPQHPPCSVCGRGNVISHPNNVLKLTGQPDLSCQEWAEAGIGGFLTQEICNLAPEFTTTFCGCQSLNLHSENQVIGMQLPVDDSTPTSVCSTFPEGGCSMCGVGKCVTKSDAMLLNRECDVLESAAYYGFMSDNECQNLSILASVTCGCAEGEISTFPSNGPTLLPSQTPSLSPSSEPSGLPSIEPTVQPSKPPSIKPVQATMKPTKEEVETTIFTNSPTPPHPSTNPSLETTISPTQSSSTSPSAQPSTNPTQVPSNEPTDGPSIAPTHLPSTEPTEGPSIAITKVPSIIPTQGPSTEPTQVPSIAPTSTEKKVKTKKDENNTIKKDDKSTIKQNDKSVAKKDKTEQEKITEKEKTDKENKHNENDNERPPTRKLFGKGSVRGVRRTKSQFAVEDINQ